MLLLALPRQQVGGVRYVVPRLPRSSDAHLILQNRLLRLGLVHALVFLHPSAHDPTRQRPVSRRLPVRQAVPTGCPKPATGPAPLINFGWPPGKPRHRVAQAAMLQ